VLYAICDRLAQPEGGWRPFERTGVRALIYPDPRRAASGGRAARQPGRAEAG
jgi:hypothetical protein